MNIIWYLNWTRIVVGKPVFLCMLAILWCLRVGKHGLPMKSEWVCQNSLIVYKLSHSTNSEYLKHHKSIWHTNGKILVRTKGDLCFDIQYSSLIKTIPGHHTGQRAWSKHRICMYVYSLSANYWFKTWCHYYYSPRNRFLQKALKYLQILLMINCFITDGVRYILLWVRYEYSNSKMGGV